MFEFSSNTVEGLVSSCKLTLKTLTVNAHVAVFPAASVAVQVTVVVPIGNVAPLGGEHTTPTPRQLSEAVGAGNVTTLLAEAGHVAVAAAVMLAGQVIVGG